MKSLLRTALPVLLILGLATLAAAQAKAPQASAAHWVCDPCNLPCDETFYDKPGVCPKCGMALVSQEAANRVREDAAQLRRKVAILIFDGVQIIDYTGPYEVFGGAGFDVYTVAETKAPVTTAMGMTVVPKYSFSDAPQPDVLVVPGGGVRAARDSAATLKWVRETTAHAAHTMSVCNGAFILASAGLLDGLTATTTAHLIDSLRSEYPKTKVVDDRRFVDNGKIITTAGLSSGIDGALHVVSLVLGNGAAQSVALGEEYDWRPSSSFARAALADRLIPHLDLPEKWDIASTQGGTDRWDFVLRGASERSVAEIAKDFERSLVKGQWANVKTASIASSASSEWKFKGRDGKAWAGTLKVAPVSGEKGQYTARLTITRAG